MLLLSALPFFLGAAKPEPLALRGELTIEVDLSTRRMVVTVDGRQVGTYDVAIGKPGHVTPVGTYKLSQVVWNPSWVPPDEEWAEHWHGWLDGVDCLALLAADVLAVEAQAGTAGDQLD